MSSTTAVNERLSTQSSLSPAPTYTSSRCSVSPASVAPLHYSRIPSASLNLSASVMDTMGARSPIIDLRQSFVSAPIGENPAPPPSTTRSFSPFAFGLPSARVVQDDRDSMAEFLTTHHDSHGLRQSALWQLTDVGNTLITFGTIITQHLQRGLNCYAEVREFVVRSRKDILFEVAITGWQTSAGWREPIRPIFAYLIAPATHCDHIFTDPGWSYFYFPDSLLLHTLNAIKFVRLYIGGDRHVRLPANDHVTGWIIHGYKRSPALMEFETELGTGITLAVEDLHVSISEGMVPPPGFSAASHSAPYRHPAARTYNA